MPRRKAVIVLVLAALVAAFFLAGGHRELSFENVKARQQEMAELYQRHPAATIAVFFASYVGLATTSLPGGAVLSLLAGALFGVALGTALVSFASSIGALLAFLAARHLLQDWVRGRYGGQLRRIDEGFERHGALYLLALRLMVVIPFMLVNVGMALTRIRPWTYYWVSQLGMLAGTLLYVNAGTRLAAVESPGDAVSPALIASLVALGLAPIGLAKLLEKYAK